MSLRKIMLVFIAISSSSLAARVSQAQGGSYNAKGIRSEHVTAHAAGTSHAKALTTTAELCQGDTKEECEADKSCKPCRRWDEDRIESYPYPRPRRYWEQDQPKWPDKWYGFKGAKTVITMTSFHTDYESPNWIRLYLDPKPENEKPLVGMAFPKQAKWKDVYMKLALNGYGQQDLAFQNSKGEDINPTDEDSTMGELFSISMLLTVTGDSPYKHMYTIQTSTLGGDEASKFNGRFPSFTSWRQVTAAVAEFYSRKTKRTVRPTDLNFVKLDGEVITTTAGTLVGDVVESLRDASVQ